MSIKIISLNKISTIGSITISNYVSKILKLNPEDEILFLLDKKGNIRVKKSHTNLLRQIEEKFVSSTKISKKYKELFWRRIYIPKDVRDILKVDIGDNILWILDENENFILRDTILLPICSKELTHKDIGSMILDMTSIIPTSCLTIPAEIKDILGLYNDKVTISLFMDEYSNIIVGSNNLNYNLLETTETMSRPDGWKGLYLTKVIKEKLNVKTGESILWLIDEEGNIILKNSILPNNCIY